MSFSHKGLIQSHRISVPDVLEMPWFRITNNTKMELHI